MLNENAKKWVAALRSGEFKQGKLVLSKRTLKQGLALKEEGERQQYVTEYCCLGVACEISKDELDLKVTQGPAGSLSYDGSISVLPEKVRKWLGLRNKAGSQYHGLPDLTVLNDREGRTFAEIADLIESEPDGLFEPEVSE